MAKRIKVRVQTEKMNINLPGIPIGLFPTVAIQALKANLKGEDRELFLQNKDVLKQLFKEVARELKTYEPFTLVEVESEDTVILIRAL